MSHYLISEASRLVGEESHVLRYWEDELALKIPRNDLGHRYYTEAELDVFRTIKELKQKGYPLREIKLYLEKDRPEAVENRPEAGRDSARNQDDDEQQNGGEKQAVEEKLAEETDDGEGHTQEQYDGNKEDHFAEGEIHQGEEQSGKKESYLSASAPGMSIPSTRQARMQEFRELMTEILADAMEAEFDRISNEITSEVSCRMIKEMNYLDREREEREEERFRALDEAIRSRQRKGKFRAEAVATSVKSGKRRRWGG